MDCRILLCFAVIFSSHVLAYRINKDDLPNDSFYDDDDYDYSYDDVDTRKENNVHSNEQNKNITTPKTATYEVTEDVDDIPNPSTKFGPIFTNFSTPRPLNNASLNVQRTTEKPDSNSESNDLNKPNEDVKGKKNSYSILHVKAEYDDPPNAPFNWGESHVHKLGIKDYIYGISKGIYNKITKLFNKHDCDDDKHVFRTHDFEESHNFRSENTKTENGQNLVHELHGDTYLLSDYE